MSAGSDVFRPTLRALEQELSLPIPDRVRILRELEFDLEELRERFVAQGLSAEDARERAVAALVPDGATLAELSRLHEPAYRRLTRGLSEDRLRRLERGALVAGTLSALTIGVLALARADLLADASPFMWPVLACGAVLVGLVALKAFELWVKSDHERPGRGLGALLGLSGVTLATGVGGVLIDLWALSGALERDSTRGFQEALAWLVRDATLLCVALLLAMAGGLAWFVLSQWVAAVIGARNEVLGGVPAPREQSTKEVV